MVLGLQTLEESCTRGLTLFVTQKKKRSLRYVGLLGLSAKH